ncbi:unnamed protein product [Rangifer tarandus platyrhynchus]|uniref:Uncharacterized protein n=2 Tax=Rangifer tarandus platyrhynchus TaxID=3082113 RepID=A0ACB0F247_RANTA|nr:unnamed protein product [Rangifer tarandus platyrhynchus]CAI9706991.1 unnamed protein product [Rangifer tarandus platyrhynchus]
MLALRAPQLCLRTRPSSRRPSPTRPCLTRRDGYSTRPGTHQPRAHSGPPGLQPRARRSLHPPLGLTPLANPPPCLGSTVGRGRKRGRATPKRFSPHPISQPAGAASTGPAPCAASAVRRPHPSRLSLVFMPPEGRGVGKRSARAQPRGLEARRFLPVAAAPDGPTLGPLYAYPPAFSVRFCFFSLRRLTSFNRA